MKTIEKDRSLFRFSFFIFLLTMTAGCAHEVYSLEVKNETKGIIAAELGKQCEEGCVIEKCWSETKSIHFCEVSFSFATSSTKKNILNKTSEALNTKGLQVGFCGRDSVGAQLVASFVTGIGRGIAAGATGGSAGPAFYGSSSSSVRTMPSVESNLLAKACDSTPVQR